MTLWRAQTQQSLFDDLSQSCDATLAADSIYALLHRERERLFPDELFADLFVEHGRRSVPPSVVATVMVLQRLSGLSDREAVERYTFDARWRYAAGGGGSCIRCWWRCASVCGARSGRTGCSRSRCMRRARRGWWVGSACWTLRRCMTRSRR